MVNLTEFTTEKNIDIGLFEKTVRRVVLQNPNLRYKNFRWFDRRLSEKNLMLLNPYRQIPETTGKTQS